MAVELDAAVRRPDDERFMELALREARRGASADEIPVGAVVVREGEVLGRGANASIERSDPTAHAEILAIRDAAKRAGNYRLTGASLFTTVEPCLMCFGAATHARLERVVFGAPDPVVGASRLFAAGRLPVNHALAVTGGVLERECAALLQAFFRERR